MLTRVARIVWTACRWTASETLYVLYLAVTPDNAVYRRCKREMKRAARQAGRIVGRRGKAAVATEGA